MRNSVKRNVYDCYLSYVQFSGIDQQSCKQYWEKYESCKQLRLSQSAVKVQSLSCMNCKYYVLLIWFIIYCIELLSDFEK